MPNPVIGPDLGVYAAGWYWTLRAETALARRPGEARAAVRAGLVAITGTMEEARGGRLLCQGLRAEADLAERARALGDQAGLTDALTTANALADQARSIARNPLDPQLSKVVAAPAVCALWHAESNRLQGEPNPDP